MMYILHQEQGRLLYFLYLYRHGWLEHGARWGLDLEILRALIVCHAVADYTCLIVVDIGA